MGELLESVCNRVRNDLKDYEQQVRGLMFNDFFEKSDKPASQRGECKAQIMLAVRHLEDVRMRLGKVLQYADDGVSILDKEKK